VLSPGLSPFDAANIRPFFYSANFFVKKMQFSVIFLKKAQKPTNLQLSQHHIAATTPHHLSRKLMLESAIMAKDFADTIKFRTFTLQIIKQ
jgi:hypothetical protein